MTEKNEEAELLSKIAALGDISEEQRNSVVCSLIGHSNIQTTFFGYYYCGRCGDSLGSYYVNPDVVIVEHNCEKCRENFARLTWKDKLFAPDPFACEEAALSEGQP